MTYTITREHYGRMSRQFRRHAIARNPQPKAITVKYAGRCATCGAEIKAGDTAEYLPPGYQGLQKGALRHAPNAWDEGERVSTVCHRVLRERASAAAANDYAGDGLDERYEDDCARACGLR